MGGERRGDRETDNEKEGKKTTFQVFLSGKENHACRTARHTKGREGEGENGERKRGGEKEKEREDQRKGGEKWEGRKRGKEAIVLGREFDILFMKCGAFGKQRRGVM